MPNEAAKRATVHAIRQAVVRDLQPVLLKEVKQYVEDCRAEVDVDLKASKESTAANTEQLILLGAQVESVHQTLIATNKSMAQILEVWAAGNGFLKVMKWLGITTGFLVTVGTMVIGAYKLFIWLI